MPNSNRPVPTLTGLQDEIASAINVGMADREAATVSRAHHESWLVDESRLAECTFARFFSVMGDVPNKVRQKVGISMTWEHDLVVPVMELTVKEYPGPTPRSPFQQPVETLSRDKLRFAAALVFDNLEAMNLQPHLHYEYNGDIRRYSLQIAIRVTARR